ncbi:hypothetical protein SOVF_089820 [Spinacia oleracea]|nr:hypothetical protein SOVF_089820 [Spinacia oleracea]
MEAMKLEIERLRLNLSAAERDKALLAVGTDPASINPNLLLDDLHMIRLCRITTSLAMVGQATIEDKITKSIVLEKNDDDVIDFWNVSGFRQSCAGGKKLSKQHDNFDTYNDETVKAAWDDNTP